MGVRLAAGNAAVSGGIKGHFTRNTPFGANAGMYWAMRLAMKYLHRTPTVGEVQADLGCHRATAYRYVRAMKDAKGEA